MKNVLFSTLILSFAVTISANNRDLNGYPFMRNAKLKGTPGTIAAIPMDQKLYKNTNHHYSNLKIIDEDGNNIPFSIRSEVPLEKRVLYAVIPANLKEFHVVPGKNRVYAELHLDPPAQISRITLPPVKGTAGMKIALQFFNEFNKKNGKTEIFSLNTQDQDSDRIILDFPPVKATKIRVELESSSADFLKTAETFLRSAEVKQAVPVTTPGKPGIVAVNLPEVSRFNKGSLTEITVDAQRVPCSELTLESDGPGAERYLEIFTKTAGKETCIASLNFNGTGKKIPLREIRGDYYIIRIHNSNHAPLQNIRLSWNVPKRVIMFQPPEKGNLKLYYGGNQKQQMYDIEFAERYSLPPQVYALEDEVDSPDFEPQIATVDMMKYLMWVILVVMTAILFIGIIRILNRSAKLEEQEK